MLEGGVADEFERRVKELFGDGVDMTKKQPTLKLKAIGEHMNDFQRLVLWLQEQAVRRLREAEPS